MLGASNLVAKTISICLLASAGVRDCERDFHVVKEYLKMYRLHKKVLCCENMPNGYTVLVFTAVKIDKFQMKNCDVFSYFLLKIFIFGYTLEPPH